LLGACALQQFILRCVLVVVCFVLNARGLEAVSWSLAVCTFALMTPFFIYFFIELYVDVALPRGVRACGSARARAA
jgi:amino acid transporter